MSSPVTWVNETLLRDATERRIFATLAIITALLVVGVLAGAIGPRFLLFQIALVGMYALLSLGLNVQWGYAGLINFSVAAFWGLGAYSAALLTAPNSPLGLGLHPVYGFLAAIVVSAVVAILIGIPTLRLREDYLAIASLGLAEVIRVIILNERQWTAGSSGISGIPNLLSWLPLTSAATTASVVVVLIALVYLFLRRIHRSPWGRVLRTIRSDEDLAKALGKDTYRFKMQAFVIGSVIMAIAGAFYAHLNLYIDPTDLVPLTTFYIWIAVILGGTGSNRGAVVGAAVVIAIREGTRFLNDIGFIQSLGLDLAPLRLLFVGALIILIMRFRQDGLLPPKDELIWPSAHKGGADTGSSASVSSDGGNVSSESTTDSSSNGGDNQ
ncbi:branched-chain amino acid ABC transporter permease [Haloferax mediterranei ATCC 33500]|uniref:Branched-chain amino acid ABC transporter permease n=1 Tax=Haloferax mediterranei (strain ATCC 33500 / DSM 1411 / JCM 8866 / NBRC 14739 / NCIMB 2177 / R-4) TaxID=523841 RepID=I3R3V7_HALMT|nr:branched-chain amino acid ABC transporter permease [Haloferax mediterranei]AFK18917.1 branched-chain amino acid ABC transporter permease protein [Haloferax mediterranei ATCC 33500]AHZ21720.1 branched-chain amino acid ABC transporter permease [Haloferax mediterranei ATCC 33500]EMA03224.1 branched-chain amino acid ABC transporter permease [Haloferax mediterranei ATCC 33500]MDX5989010.1 branched-chain amino acid ABC transporter permease [Haloferax mediterranei ATCC 33500]QCQ75403.1 branched-ch